MTWYSINTNDLLEALLLVKTPNVHIQIGDVPPRQGEFVCILPEEYPDGGYGQTLEATPIFPF